MTPKDGKTRRRAVGLTAVPLVLFIFCGCRAGNPSAAPSTSLARVDVRAGEIRITYEGAAVFSGKIAAAEGGFQSIVNVYRRGDKADQVILLTAGGRGDLRVSGTIFGSPESFPCEADRRERGLAFVHHASGLSRSLLNRAVYDRLGDWVFSVDSGPRVRVTPEKETPKTRAFSVAAEGGEIVLRFRPRYYQAHRGLRFFEPRTYKIWPRSVAGWVSWFAFFDKVTEKDIVETADTLSSTLLPFGYDYLQIDDGYQKGEGLPEFWLGANAKFPGGLEFLARYIKSKGLKPGLWTNVAFKQAEFAASHADWFVTDSSGRPAPGNWIGLSLDASSPHALDRVVKPVFKGLREMGWEYYKVDALRHLRYEGYNAHADYFRRKNLDLTRIYRRYIETIRDEIGREHFLLGCWGIRPELIGLLDGCRIGTDGFSYAGLAQYNSWNNVVWRNDPDHIELNEDRYRSTLVTSLTGSILLLTDKPAIYRTEAAEPARRAAPVLWTLPGQLFDVDPSRSSELARVDTEVSGSGPRVFDAGLRPTCDLFLLDVSRPFESWSVLGRTGESVPEVKFGDIGLDPLAEYYVFEFWSKKLIGSFKGGFAPGPLDPIFRSQAFAIRDRKPHPQVLSTNRHVTSGGVDLLDVQWKDGGLSGVSRVVGGDPYVVYLTEPDGFRLEAVACDGASHIDTRRRGGLVEIRWLSKENRDIRWDVKYKTQKGG